MSIFDSLNISGSALVAERQRSEIAATNLANVDATHTASGVAPYRRREVVLTTTGSPFHNLLSNAATETAGVPNGSVRLSRIVEDTSPAIRRYDPGHPDADKDGYVSLPNINPVQEMVDLMGSVRSYQLNASAATASKQIIQQSIDLLKS